MRGASLKDDRRALGHQALQGCRVMEGLDALMAVQSQDRGCNELALRLEGAYIRWLDTKFLPFLTRQGSSQCTAARSTGGLGKTRLLELVTETIWPCGGQLMPGD